MPVRMQEEDRIRGTKRVAQLIINAIYYGKLTCVYCLDELDKDNIPHVDHLKARKKGGGSKTENLVVCCNSCNGRKCDTNVEKVFGSEIANRVWEHVARRTRLTDFDKQVATDINAMTSKTAEVIEMVLDYAQLGLAPIRLR